MKDDIVEITVKVPALPWRWIAHTVGAGMLLMAVTSGLVAAIYQGLWLWAVVNAASAGIWLIILVVQARRIYQQAQMDTYKRVADILNKVMLEREQEEEA